MNTFKVTYVTTLPNVGNSPKIEINGDIDDTYLIKVYERINDKLKFITEVNCPTNQYVLLSLKQWYSEWVVEIFDSMSRLVYVDIFNLTNKVVFIKMDAFAIGDSIAWIPYIEEFRKKHNCTVICSTFHNDLFISSYPNILFVKPNTQIDNVYAQYYVGASSTYKPKYSPINVNEHPLQHCATRILGLDNIELRPDLTNLCKHTKKVIDKKYVTISEFSSKPEKEWRFVDGWQEICDYLNSVGYTVIVISKEKTNLKNVVDLTGEHSLLDRAYQIYHSEFFMGVSSGLSWLAWALNKHVVMISDATPIWHEFNTNITRLSANELEYVSNDYQFVTNPKEVIKSLSILVS
jgi:autotransporter strand-loop-strand O-heptosyltransferase